MEGKHLGNLSILCALCTVITEIQTRALWPTHVDTQTVEICTQKKNTCGKYKVRSPGGGLYLFRIVSCGGLRENRNHFGMFWMAVSEEPRELAPQVGFAGCPRSPEARANVATFCGDGNVYICRSHNIVSYPCCYYYACSLWSTADKQTGVMIKTHWQGLSLAILKKMQVSLFDLFRGNSFFFGTAIPIRDCLSA